MGVRGGSPIPLHRALPKFLCPLPRVLPRFPHRARIPSFAPCALGTTHVHQHYGGICPHAPRVTPGGRWEGRGLGAMSTLWGTWEDHSAPSMGHQEAGSGLWNTLHRMPCTGSHPPAMALPTLSPIPLLTVLFGKRVLRKLGGHLFLQPTSQLKSWHPGYIHCGGVGVSLSDALNRRWQIYFFSPAHRGKCGKTPLASMEAHSDLDLWFQLKPRLQEQMHSWAAKFVCSIRHRKVK